MLDRLILPVVKGMFGDNRRAFGKNDRHLVRDQLPAVQRAEFGQLAGCAAISLAEIVLTAGVEFDVGRQHVAIFLQKADQAAVMVEVTVANDHSVDLRGIGAGQLDVVEQRFRRIAEVEHDRALFIPAL